MAQEKDFEQLFKETLDKLHADIKLAGTNITQICKLAGCGRNTPDRWAAASPSTIMLVKKMQGIVAQKLADKK